MNSTSPFASAWLFGCCLVFAPSLHAQITCTATMSNLDFGNVDPATGQSNSATFTYRCSSSALLFTYSAKVCFSIGEPGGGPTNPRQMSSGANRLNFQLFQDPAKTVVWGSEYFGVFRTPIEVNVTLAPGSSVSNTPPVTLYGQVLPGQMSTALGTYQDIYAAGDTAVTVNTVSGNTPPSVCGGSTSATFPFTVSATIIKQCVVSASPLNFGTPAGLLSANVDATTTIQTTCTNGTPYQIGLDNGQNSSGALRRMFGGSGDLVAYELYRNTGRTQRWGNTPSTDTMNYTGNGLVQSATVYGRVAPQTTPSPGAYLDTITVNVTY